MSFEGISERQRAEYRARYESNALYRAVGNALSKHGIGDVAFSSRGRNAAQFRFSHVVPTLPAANQKKSGRCWIFAALNVLRELTAKKLNLAELEFSQNYMAFWDKFEKANYFLESVIALAGRPVDDRLLSYVLDTAVQDGGQWDMFVNLVEKYGVAPKSAMEETFQSSNTADMNKLLNAKLRRGAALLRAEVAAGGDPRALRLRIMDEVHALLCLCFGQPPQTFDFEYVDKDKNFHADRDLTPKSFYEKYVGLDLKNDYVSLINSPTGDKPFYRTVAIDWLGNVAEGRPVRYLNLPMDELKDLIVRQLKDGECVWFGSDVGKKGARDMGIWSDACFDYEGTFAMDFAMTKGERLDLRDSAMNHAMVITGVNLDAAGQPNRWKIENSWGDEHGDKGYYLMDGGWFDQYVYQAVINKKHLSEKQLAALETEPLHFFPWDPMGTLAE